MMASRVSADRRWESQAIVPASSQLLSAQQVNNAQQFSEISIEDINTEVSVLTWALMKNRPR